MANNSSFYGKGTRALMALSTVAPAIGLLGVKGIGEKVTWFTSPAFFWGGVGTSLLLIWVLPWFLLVWFTERGTQKVVENVIVQEAGDHMLVYAVAVILPLWAGETGSDRELCATALAFVMVWLLIASSNLHHANLYLRMCGYRFFSATPAEGSTGADSAGFLILSKTDISSPKATIHCAVIDGRMLLARQPHNTTPCL